MGCQEKAPKAQGNVKVIINERSHDHERYLSPLASKNID